MATVVIPATDSSGVPLTGLSPTWYCLYNAATEVAYTPQPAISAVGGGLYKFTQPNGVDLTGIVDMGATATPRYMVYGANHSTTFAAFDTTPTPKAGLSTSWNTIRDVDTGTAFTPQPTIVELGLGMYKIARHTGRAVGFVDMSSSAAPRYIGYDSEEIRATVATATPDAAPTLTPIDVAQSVLPIDLKVGTSGELVLTEGDLVFTSGVDATAQQCDLTLRSFRGEWFADLDSGTPWFQDVLGQKWNELKVRGVIRDALLGVSTVKSVQRLRLTFDGATRTVDVNWTVLSTEGATIAGVTTI